MAEMLKACTQHESSSCLASKLGPHMLGFLSGMAISGSVALISFLMGKHKLTKQGGRQHTWTSHSQEGFEEEEEEPYTRDVEEIHSHLDSSCKAYKENVHSPTHFTSFMHSPLYSSYKHSPTHLKRFHEGKEPTTSKRKTKVSFASHVVAPPSNAQQYRSKRRASHACGTHTNLDVDEPPCNDQVLDVDGHYKSKRRVLQGYQVHAHFGTSECPCNDSVDVERLPYNKQQYQTTHNVLQGDKTHAQLLHPKKHAKFHKASKGCEMYACLSHSQVPSKSPCSIPTNQLALYKGLWQSRLEQSLHCL